MDFEQGLTVELSALAGLTGNVFPIMAAQGTQPPYLTYNLGSNDRTLTLTGHDGLVESQYQLDLYHVTYGGLKALKKLLLQTIKTFEHRQMGVTGPYVQQVMIMTDFETYEDAVKLYRGVIEFTVNYTE